MTTHEIETAVQAFRAAGATRGLFYLSTPITTGRRELELMDKLGITSRSELRESHSSDWRRLVVEPNEQFAIESADRFVETVALGRLVVNPAMLNRDHWSQDDYDNLWHRVIREFPVTLVPLEGWAYSRGARLEVALALEIGLHITRLDGTPYTYRDITTDIQAAEDDIQRHSWRAIVGELPPVTPDAGTRKGLGPGVRPAQPSFQRQVMVWLSAEHTYQVKKFGVVSDDANTRDTGIDEGGWWDSQLKMYFHRARILGLDNSLGRQALAKFVATGCGLLESVIRVHGALPPAGAPSGETRGPI